MGNSTATVREIKYKDVSNPELGLQGLPFEEYANKLLGQHVAVVAVRYQYRGILTAIGKGYVILNPAMAVEEAGPSMGEKPTVEDVLPGEILIKTDAMELLWQPKWAFAPFPVESPRAEKQRLNGGV